jgi:NAD+ kinase
MGPRATKKHPRPAPATGAAPKARSGRPKVAYLLKRSAWQVFVEEKSDARLRALLRRGDPTVARLRSAHESHVRTTDEVLGVLAKLGAVTTEIDDAPFEMSSKELDLVVTIGGDGTLLRASHWVSDVPILGINSAPDSSVGFFCALRRGDARRALERAFEGTLPGTVLTRMKVTLGGKVVAKRVLNDALFCHASPAATSRYIIELGGVVEEHKSSGFWIGPAAGSTAAQRSAGGKVLPLTSPDLQLVVREPYTPQGERHQVRRALVPPGGSLVVRSKMREGAMFFDGPEEVVHPAFGDVIEFERADEPLRLLGISASRRRAKW